MESLKLSYANVVITADNVYRHSVAEAAVEILNEIGKYCEKKKENCNNFVCKNCENVIIGIEKWVKMLLTVWYDGLFS